MASSPCQVGERAVPRLGKRGLVVGKKSAGRRRLAVQYQPPASLATARHLYTAINLRARSHSDLASAPARANKLPPRRAPELASSNLYLADGCSRPIGIFYLAERLQSAAVAATTRSSCSAGRLPVAAQAGACTGLGSDFLQCVITLKSTPDPPLTAPAHFLEWAPLFSPRGHRRSERRRMGTLYLGSAHSCRGEVSQASRLETRGGRRRELGNLSAEARRPRHAQFAEHKAAGSQRHRRRLTGGRPVAAPLGPARSPDGGPGLPDGRPDDSQRADPAAAPAMFVSGCLLGRFWADRLEAAGSERERPNNGFGRR